MFGRFRRYAVVVILAGILLPSSGFAARIKDIAFFEGVRSNQIVGFGLVVGLSGTGDKTTALFTLQAIANMLDKMGMQTNPQTIMVKNTATVLVTAELPPFMRPGSKVDVLVSSLGDATSLQGGTLISTPLKGPDGKVYAVAQGAVSLGGYSAGNAGASVVKNHQTAGKIPDGAIVERDVPLELQDKENIFLTLREPDFTTSERIADTINMGLNGPVAQPVDAGRVRISVPDSYRSEMVAYMSRIERLDVKPDTVTRVVVNERTGTVVMGENVKISTVAISHGDISIEIKTQYEISQPAALSPNGETVVAPVEETKVKEEKSRLILLPESVTLGDVVRALNLVGVTPRDLIAILQAIKAEGALQAELEII